mgnify:CR=1 FL=1
MSRWVRDEDDPGLTRPRPVAEGLDSLARRLGLPNAAVLGALFRRWDEVVGEAIAAHARPRSLNDGVLVVSVDEPAWATQLRYLAPQLCDRLAEVTGDRLVERLEVRVERHG